MSATLEITVFFSNMCEKISRCSIMGWTSHLKSDMRTDSAKKILGDLPLSLVDVTRLFVEAAEECGIMEAPRAELIAKFRQMVRMGAKSMNDASNTRTFGEVVELAVQAHKQRRKSTYYDWRSYTGRMVRYKDWAQLPLRSFNAEICKNMLNNVFGHSPHAFKKARSILHSLFTYGMRQDWCDKNPVDAIDIPRIAEKRIVPLDIQEVKRLTKACRKDADMRAAVSLMLWCGVRPGEIQRVKWGDIDVGEGVVYIDSTTSKTGGTRIIPLRGLACELRIRQHPDTPVAPRNWAARWRALRLQAGFTHWQADVLRHTFASMHMRHFENPPQLQAEMGHRDASLLRTRYVNLRNLTKRAAAAFWEDP